MYYKKIILITLLFAISLISCTCGSRQDKHVKKGKQYLAKEAFEDAAAEFMVALKRNPSDPEINYLRIKLCEYWRF
jgi:flagellar basal body-associated protein FliL